MSELKPTKEDMALTDSIVFRYEQDKGLVHNILHGLLGHIQNSENLSNTIHSTKHRLKDPSHLKDKILRKMVSARENKKPFDIEPDNLLTKVTDLAGIRLLHLHTHQIAAIDKELRSLFDEYRYELIEKPFARSWDDESKAFFADLGYEIQKSESLYTSVHYVIGSNSKTMVTCEIQVRTLMEEVWGEVDHMINYPHNTSSIACKEQLKALARVTSGASRLVDSIFASHDEHKKGTEK